MEIELFSHLYYAFSYRPDLKVILFRWTAATAAMTLPDYQEALHNFAGFAFGQQTTGLVVDVRDFRFRPGPELGNWRDDVISPRYVRWGVRKFAYVAAAGALEGMNGAMHDRRRGFEEDYFPSGEAALRWIDS